MRFLLFLLLALSALSARAAPSLCGHLPEAGKIAISAPVDSVPARPRANRMLGCPPGYTLDASARPPACRRAGMAAADGNPRAACRASLPLGPVADVPAQYRPTRSCPDSTLTAVIRLEGANVGLADVTLSTQSPGVTLTTLDDDGKAADPAQIPAAQGCFGHQCRLVEMQVTAEASDAARLQLAIEDGEQVTVTVPLQTHCPDPAARPVPAGLRSSTERKPVPPTRR